MAKIITVISGKGGVGKSTFCVNTAKSLCENGKKVLLVDGDIGLRSLDMLLGVDNMVLYDWSDVLLNRCDKYKARLFYSDNLQLLPAPLEMVESLDVDAFKALISQYADGYDYVIVDSPAGIGELPTLYAKCADECIIVATADNVSARSAGVVGDQLVNMGIAEEKIRLIINRFDKNAVKLGKMLNIDDVIDITYLRLLGVVPEDKKLTHASVVDAELSTRNRTKIAFNNIAGRILGKEILLNL